MPVYNELFYSCFIHELEGSGFVLLSLKLWTASTLSIPTSLFDSPST